VEAAGIEPAWHCRRREAGGRLEVAGRAPPIDL